MNRSLALGGLAVILLGGYFVAVSASPINYSLAVIGLIFSVSGFILFGRGLGRRVTKERLRVGLDPMAMVLDAVLILSVLFGGLAGLIGSDQASINLSQFLIGMQLSAIVMGFATGSRTLTLGVGRAQFRSQLFLIITTLGMFFVLNLIVPPKLPIFFQTQSLATSGRFVTDMISIPEENLFRGWLAPFLGNLSHTGIAGGAAGSAVLFMTYHLFVLGTDPSKLFIVFAAGLVSGFTALRTRLMSSTMVPHFTNNFLATGGF